MHKVKKIFSISVDSKLTTIKLVFLVVSLWLACGVSLFWVDKRGNNATKENLQELRNWYLHSVKGDIADHLDLFLNSLASLLAFVERSELLDKDSDRNFYFSVVSSLLTSSEKTFLFYYMTLDLPERHATFRLYEEIESKFTFLLSTQVELYHSSHTILWDLDFLKKINYSFTVFNAEQLFYPLILSIKFFCLLSPC